MISASRTLVTRSHELGALYFHIFLLIDFKKVKGRKNVGFNCGKYNLRDVNASLNILSEDLRILTAAVGIPEALNACEELVRPGSFQAEIVEAGIA
ncbi:MAG: hypothetical protein V7L23_19020 [Nostoc sp.]|uniref:hypothetical protein n=1 Tax=Nostoc sp. TaxID=1180 RepID=UPI002FEF2E04